MCRCPAPLYRGDLSSSCSLISFDRGFLKFGMALATASATAAAPGSPVVLEALGAPASAWPAPLAVSGAGESSGPMSPALGSGPFHSGISCRPAERGSGGGEPARPAVCPGPVAGGGDKGGSGREGPSPGESGIAPAAHACASGRAGSAQPRGEGCAGEEAASSQRPGEVTGFGEAGSVFGRGEACAGGGEASRQPPDGAPAGGEA
mmetsp:Transcript_11207/g.33769  ORF Transcript_11207/g.33769 Transcript_11207/m.33769 type:complete len:206 (-) Transcript_11207:133-750(-)